MAADFINLYVINSQANSLLNFTAIKKGLFILLIQVFTCIASLCLHSTTLCAQQYYFKRYGIEDGLAQSQVTSIYQDNGNYLWFGTQSGVSRFNGTDFVNYTKINGIHGNMVGSVFQDNKRILLRTGIGLSSVENNRVTNFFVAANYAFDNHLLKSHDGKIWLIARGKLYQLLKDRLSRFVVANDYERVAAIALNNDGEINAAVAGEGIFCLSNNKWIKKAAFDSSYKKLDIAKIQFDRFDKNKIWLLGMDKLYQVVNGVVAVFRDPLLDKYNGEFLDIAQDREGAIWLGSDNGAFYIGKTSSIHFTHSNGFTSRAVTAIYCDREDIVWLASNGEGVYKFQGFNLVSYDKIGGSPMPIVAGMSGDKYGNIWGCTSRIGLIRIRDNHLSNVLLPDTNAMASSAICLSYQNKQPLLIGASRGVWQLDGDKFTRVDKQFTQYINTITYDKNNRIWVGTPAGLYYEEGGRFKQVESPSRSVVALCAIGKDSILAGTFDGVTLIVNHKIDTGFRIPRLKNTTILSILKVNRLLLIGTVGEGIFLLDIKNGKLKNISSLNGLKSNDVYSLLAADENTIWAGTGKGIDKFQLNEADLSVKLINDIVPNPTVEYNQNSILKFDNKIWLSNNVGIFAFDIPNGQNLHRPVINVEGVKLITQSNTKSGSSSQAKSSAVRGYQFHYSNNRIVISFKGIYYTDPDHLQYQYRLIGLESRFSAPSKSTTVDYTSLKPGKYRFEVQAVSAQGTKSDVKSIAIEIIPAFYQTSWFYILMFILLVALIVLLQQYVIYRKKVQKALIERLKREEQIKIREQTAEDFHDDIGNKLTRIAILADVLKKKTSNESDDGKKLIEQIKENASALYTDTKDILWALDPQSENLVEIFSFVKNLATDVFSHTDIRVQFNQFDFKQNKYELPLDFSRNISMIFREILHNVLKHANASEVTINCLLKGQRITIEVADNGKGFNPQLVHEGKGLNNIRVRARRINGEIEIVSGNGTGTVIKLHFNVNG